jgi:hypothetical protein
MDDKIRGKMWRAVDMLFCLVTEYPLHSWVS